MKVVINQGKVEEEVKFPKLYQSSYTGAVVLFFKETCGTVMGYVSTDKGTCTIGEYQDFWFSCFNEKYWTPFNGTITLSNN